MDLTRSKQGRLTGALEDYYASPVGADGKGHLNDVLEPMAP